MIFTLRTENSPELLLKSFTDKNFRNYTFKKDGSILLNEVISGTDVQERKFLIRKENSIPYAVKKISGLTDVEFEISETINTKDYKKDMHFEVSNINLKIFKIKGKRCIDKDEYGTTVINYDINVSTILGSLCKHFIEKSYKKSQIEYLVMVEEFYKNNYTAN